jgi:two-component system CheB/CheR fusion protein
MVHAGDIMSTKKIADRSLKNSDKVSPKDSKVFKHEASAITLAKKDFHIVGIGASAGGLKAFEEFFRGMPTDAELNMAFVLVQHMAPDHKSILAELIRRYSSMSVFEVEDGMKVQANCIYIIPPRFDMSFCTGTLQLLDPIAPHGQRLPIDFFFRSLAHGQQERTIGLVLSGTGSDGTSPQNLMACLKVPLLQGWSIISCPLPIWVLVSLPTSTIFIKNSPIAPPLTNHRTRAS